VLLFLRSVSQKLLTPGQEFQRGRFDKIEFMRIIPTSTHKLHAVNISAANEREKIAAARAASLIQYYICRGASSIFGESAAHVKIYK